MAAYLRDVGLFLQVNGQARGRSARAKGGAPSGPGGVHGRGGAHGSSVEGQGAVQRHGRATWATPAGDDGTCWSRERVYVRTNGAGAGVRALVHLGNLRHA